jgi:hypothetical protein
VLHHGSSGFVLGHDLAPWHDPDKVLAILSGKEAGAGSRVRLATPALAVPDRGVDQRAERAAAVSQPARGDGLPGREYFAPATVTALPRDLRDDLETELEREIDGASFFQRENPLVRHVVLRKRVTLEERGLLARIAVNVHPAEKPGSGSRRPSMSCSRGSALRTTATSTRPTARRAAFGEVLAKRARAAAS